MWTGMEFAAYHWIAVGRKYDASLQNMYVPSVRLHHY